MKWTCIDDELPEIKNNCWRTNLPLYVKVEGFGISLAYPCKWNDDPFCWIPANIMCNENQEYAPVDDKKHIIGVTHWMKEPK